MHYIFKLCLLLFATTVVTNAKKNGYDEEAVRKGDSYIDKMLEDMFNNKDEEYDPYDLEDSAVGFHRKVMFVNVSGEAKLHDGYIKGLSTLHRAKHCTLHNEGNKLRVKADLGAGELELHYRGSVKFMNFGPTITVTGTLSYIEVFMEFTVDSKTGRDGKLTDFVIDDMRGMKVRVSGLGPINWAVNPIISGVTKVFKRFVRNFMENKVEKHLKEHIPNYQFPVEGGEITETPETIPTETEEPEETTTETLPPETETPEPEPETETPEPEPETETPEPEPETETPEPEPETETPEPEPETEAPEPEPETEAPEPEPETEAPEPEPETEAPEPEPETEAPEPEPETEAPEPEPETEAPEPEPETEAPEPEPETEAPEPEPETEAPEPEPETEAPEPEPETEAPEPEPETEAPEPEPETEAPEPEPETEAPEPEPELPEENPEPDYEGNLGAEPLNTRYVDYR